VSSLPTGQPACQKIDYVTTAIVYPNANMHLGFAWETIATDWIARSKRLLGRPTYFVTGMDEHSINVAKAAEAKGLTPKDYCDEMAVKTKATLESLNVKFDRFIRTSDADHEKVVQALVQKAFDSGDVYRAKYEGHYCEGCEAFYLDKDLLDGKCPHHKSVPKWISEENYFFKLSKYQDALLKLFSDRPDFLQPESRRAEVVNFIQAGLKDFSISRSTFDWGIPLPFDEKHIVYVWFDALVNYVTAAGYAESEAVFKSRWPASLHVIGKDITRFHCIYWPAMLMAVNLPLPERVFAHGFLNLRGERLSKSSGNLLYPADVLKVASSDALRYYLLAENQFGQDGNFAFDLLAFKVNADLSNDLGNLVNRTINMTKKYFPDEVLMLQPKVTHSKEVRESFELLKKELASAVEEVNTTGYAQACTARSRILNLYIDRTKPWALAKTNTPESMDELREVLFTLLEGIRWVAASLSSIIPVGMEEVYRQLDLPFPEELGRVSHLQWGEVGFKVGEPKPVYPRIELPKEESV
jgi:methionyl-tRNA synthetase